VLDPDGFYSPLWTFLADLVPRGFVRQQALDQLVRVTSVDEAFAVIAQA
jgi:hypothetical protein